eukprot:5937943-Prymnesium_polylepis.1
MVHCTQGAHIVVHQQDARAQAKAEVQHRKLVERARKRGPVPGRAVGHVRSNDRLLPQDLSHPDTAHCAVNLWPRRRADRPAGRHHIDWQSCSREGETREGVQRTPALRRKDRAGRVGSMQNEREDGRSRSPLPASVTAGAAQPRKTAFGARAVVSGLLDGGAGRSAAPSLVGLVARSTAAP